MTDNIEEVENKVDVDDIDSLLESYKSKTLVEKPSNEDIENSESEKVTPNAHEPATATANTDPNAWRGNPAYFQTGKKAGQLRPMAKGNGTGINEKQIDEMSISGSLIDGGLFLMLVDMIFPLIIVVANNKFNDTKIKVDDLQLTERQKKDLTPVATEVIKQLSISADPKWLLLGSLLGIYGINNMAVISGSDSKGKD